MIESEYDAAFAYAKAWNRLDAEPFLALLAEDARYSSAWVLNEELESRQAIRDYLTAKMKTVRNYGVNNPASRVRAELGVTRGPFGGRDCVAVVQGRGEDISAAVIFEVADGEISKFDMCLPQVLYVKRSGVYPI